MIETSDLMRATSYQQIKLMVEAHEHDQMTDWEFIQAVKNQVWVTE